MRKLLSLFALLLVLPLCAAAQDASALDVCILTPVAFSAAEEGGTPALYCGPTQGSYRIGEQTLDLSKPYVFFGQSDCWAMVAQGTPDAFGPVGWVESALLDVLPDDPELSFDDALAAMVEEDAPVTNDPLGAGSEQWDLTLPRGTEVVVLASFGDWLYIQTEISGRPARVFIPAGSIL